jgi:transcription elongation GreA/GreB family factor/transcription elongation factor GreA-like protein
MQADIQKAIEAGKLTAKAGEALAKLSPGTYVNHKSWGYGQISDVDFLLQQMTLNFTGKRGHSMQLVYATESLTVIPGEHIAAKKLADMAAVKSSAKNDPVGLSRCILQSFGGKATQDQLQTALVPDVMSESEFKKWFEVAKKAMKAEGHFAIPTKKGLPFELRDGPISHADEYLAAFNNARQIKDQTKAVELIIKHATEFTDPVGQLQPVIVAVNDSAKKSAKLKPEDTISLLATRDELLERIPTLAAGTDAPGIAGILQDERAQLSALLSKSPDSKLTRAVAAIPPAFGDDWPQRAISVVLRAEKARLASEAANLMAKNGQGDTLRIALERAISEHGLSSAALCWLCEDRVGWFSELLNHKVASAIVSALERDAHNERKDRKLHDLLVNDSDLIIELMRDASTEELRDFMRKLLLSTVFEDLNRRSLLGKIVRVHPDLQSMITGGSEQKDESIIVSWESLEKKKAELDELVNKKIPENVKEIAIARDYGDLRENFEFKAAKEMQRVLGRRRADAERDLGLARGSDFTNADASQVGIGTIVTLKDVKDGSTNTYTILGAWDGDPEKGILSYLSALAKTLLGHKPGDQLDVPTEHGERTVVIEKIERYRS